MIRLNVRDLQRLSAAARTTAGDEKPARRRRTVPDGNGPALAADGAALGRIPRTPHPGGEVRIEIDIPPQPKERARTFMDERALARAFASASGDIRRFMAAVKSRRNGGDGVMRSVTPESTRQFEEIAALVAGRAMAAAGLAPFGCPLEMTVEFRFDGDPGTWPTAHADGDLDNLEKSLKDALIGVAYADDRLIVRKTGIKVCSARAGISLTIRPAAP